MAVALRVAALPVWRPVAQPAGFTYALPFTIQRKGRTFRPHPSFNLRTYSGVDSQAGIDYYVSTTGSDANTGLSWAQALRNIYTACGKTTPRIIYIATGTYPWANNHRGMTTWYALIGVGGQVVLNNNLELTSWTASGSTFWASTTQAVDIVLDYLNVDAQGYPTSLASRSSEAEVDANPGSFWKDGATNRVYVRTIDSRSPDSSIFVSRAFSGLIFNTVNHPVYLENITFECVGGTNRLIRLYPSDGVSPLKAYFKHCIFRHNYGSYDNLDCDGTAETICLDCESYNGQSDGFNYHQTPLFCDPQCHRDQLYQ